MNSTKLKNTAPPFVPGSNQKGRLDLPSPSLEASCRPVVVHSRRALCLTSVVRHGWYSVDPGIQLPEITLDGIVVLTKAHTRFAYKTAKSSERAAYRGIIVNIQSAISRLVLFVCFHRWSQMSRTSQKHDTTKTYDVHMRMWILGIFPKQTEGGRNEKLWMKRTQY